MSIGIKKPIEGNYKLVESHNFREYLSVLGVGPFTQDMVMKAGVVLTIEQELDKQWRISTENLIKARSVKGYMTRERKLTKNKYKEGEPKYEMLEDWDPRDVFTVLNVNLEGNRIFQYQEAINDGKSAMDSTVEFELMSENPDLLVVTYSIGDVIASRKFERKVSLRH